MSHSLIARVLWGAVVVAVLATRVAAFAEEPVQSSAAPASQSELSEYDMIQEAAAAIRSRWDKKPDVGIVLGSGLGGFAASTFAAKGGEHYSFLWVCLYQSAWRFRLLSSPPCACRRMGRCLYSIKPA